MFRRLAAYMERRTSSAEAATEARTRANLTNTRIEILQLQSAITRCKHEERLSTTDAEVMQLEMQRLTAKLRLGLTNAEVMQLEGQRLMEKLRLSLTSAEVLRARRDLEVCRHIEEKCRIKAAKARSEIMASEKLIDAKRKQIQDPLEQCMRHERAQGEHTEAKRLAVLTLQEGLNKCRTGIAVTLHLQSAIAAIADGKNKEELYTRSVALLDSLREEESYTQPDIEKQIESLERQLVWEEKVRCERQNLEKLMHECAMEAEALWLKSQTSEESASNEGSAPANAASRDDIHLEKLMHEYEIDARALWLKSQASEESASNEKSAPANATNQCDTQVASMLSDTQASNDNHVQCCALQ